MPPHESDETEENLQIAVSSATKKDLRMKAAESGETIRLIVLRALFAAGVEVPSEDLLDRRRTK